MKGGEEFIITFDGNFYNPADILHTSEGRELEVIKVYKLTWWKRILMWFGVPFRSMDVKVRIK